MSESIKEPVIITALAGILAISLTSNILDRMRMQDLQSDNDMLSSVIADKISYCHALITDPIVIKIISTKGKKGK